MTISAGVRKQLWPAAALFGALAVAGCTGMYMKLPDDPPDAPSDITVTPITAALVAAHAKAADGGLTPTRAEGIYRYRIGVGDILDITIPSIAAVPSVGTPAYAGPREKEPGYTVSPDGSIFVPFIGAQQVVGLTIREVQDKVVQGLSRYIKVPQVTVSVAQFRSQKVMMAGQVPKPGFLPISDVPLTLVGALMAAGSTPMLRNDLVARPLLGSAGGAQPESGDYGKVRITRKSQAYTVNVMELLRSGDMQKDPLLLDGDVVYVPPVQRGYVYVLGEVRTPAIVEVVEQSTSLAEVLMASGGVNQQTSNAERVYVIRGQLDKPQVFQLNSNAADALLLADAFDIRPRDVVYVAEANISRWNRFLSQLVPTIQSLLTGGVIANQAKP